MELKAQLLQKEQTEKYIAIKNNNLSKHVTKWSLSSVKPNSLKISIYMIYE